MARQKPSGEDAYFNSIQEARYVEPEEEGYVFEFGEGELAFVRTEEFGEEGPPEGFGAELLVQRPYGSYWAASMQMAEKLELWDSIIEHFEEGHNVEGDIIRENKGGLSVDIGLRAFLPRSQVDIHRVDDCSPYVGRRETFKIIEFKEERCEVILSRRKVLEEQRGEQRAKTLEKIEPDAVFEGTVRNIVDYGAFVDIGGIEGLLHVSNMSWGRIDHPSELLRPGDELRVVVLEYDESRDRLSLGRKQLMDDPWESIEERFEIDEVVEGTVVSLADFGAFVEVAPGLEGLVHVTELAWLGRINHPRDVLNLEQDVRVKIIQIDLEKKRLELSIKRLETNPWELLAEKIAPGDRVSGPIRNIEDFGLFVEIFPGIEGLVHVSDLSWTEAIENPADHYDVGDEVEVVVLDIDTDSQRAGLGIKQLEDDPWERAAEIAKPGKKIEGEVTRIEDYGAFVEVIEGVEGLIHISELRDERVERVADVVKPGRTVEPLVLSFDRGNRRIGLSLKRDSLDEEQMRSYDDTEGATSTLGDILRDSLGIGEGEDESAEPAEEVEEVAGSAEDVEEVEEAEEEVEEAAESADEDESAGSSEEDEQASEGEDDDVLDDEEAVEQSGAPTEEE